MDLKSIRICQIIPILKLFEIPHFALEIQWMISLDFKSFDLFVIQIYSTNLGHEFKIPRIQICLFKWNLKESERCLMNKLLLEPKCKSSENHLTMKIKENKKKDMD